MRGDLPDRHQRPFQRRRLRYDQTFANEVAYCEDKGIPHSVFLGRVVGPDDPYWLPEDRAKIIAWRLEKAEKCTRCGTADWEWDADPDAYTPVAQRCMGCHKINVASEEFSRDRSVQVVLMRQAVAAVLARRPRRRPQRRRRSE